MGDIADSSTSGNARTSKKHPFLKLFQPPELKAQLEVHLNTHLETHCATTIEEVFIMEMDEMDPDLLAPNCISEDGFTTLHYAAALGLTTLAGQMLSRGYTKLLYRKTRDEKLPIELAMDNEEFATAAVLMRNMKERSLYLFKRCKDKCGDLPPQFSLTELLKRQCEQPTTSQKTQDVERGGSVKRPQEQTDSPTRKQRASISMDTTDSGKKLNQLMLAVMDTAAECGEEEIDNVLGMTEDGDVELDGDASWYFLINKYKIEALRKHKSLQHVANKKWAEYGFTLQMILFLVYMVFTAILTTALALAAKASEPRMYNDPIDGFRLFCEIVTFGYTCVDFGLEVKDMCRNTQRKKWDVYQRKWMNYLRAVKLHCLEWENFLDCLAIICTLFIIPFRLADSNFQWVFAALAYIFHALRIFKFAILFESVGIYVQILLRVINHDVPQFLLVFSVIVLAFGGGLNFALRESSSAASNLTDVNPVDNTSIGMNPSETSEVHLTWLLGFRILAEGSVRDYTTYRWLAVIIYWLLIFTISVVLLNLLIAQFSKTYEEETEHAEISVALMRLEILQKLDTVWWGKWAKEHIAKPIQTRIIDALKEAWGVPDLESTRADSTRKQLGVTEGVWLVNKQLIQNRQAIEKKLQEEVMKLKTQQESEMKELKGAVKELKDILLKHFPPRPE